MPANLHFLWLLNWCLFTDEFFVIVDELKKILKFFLVVLKSFEN